MVRERDRHDLQAINTIFCQYPVECKLTNQPTKSSNKQIHRTFLSISLETIFLNFKETFIWYQTSASLMMRLLIQDFIILFHLLVCISQLNLNACISFIQTQFGLDINDCGTIKDEIRKARKPCPLRFMSLVKLRCALLSTR